MIAAQVFAVDVNGHFVTAVAAWVVDGDGEEAKAVIQAGGFGPC